jgi:hypothetical protein
MLMTVLKRTKIKSITLPIFRPIHIDSSFFPLASMICSYPVGYPSGFVEPFSNRKLTTPAWIVHRSSFMCCVGRLSFVMSSVWLSPILPCLHFGFYEKAPTVVESIFGKHLLLLSVQCSITTTDRLTRLLNSYYGSFSTTS